MVVIAQGMYGRIITATVFVARIHGTCDPIKAKGVVSGGRTTIDLITGIDGAGDAVVAQSVAWCMETAVEISTGVDGTRISIIAIDHNRNVQTTQY